MMAYLTRPKFQDGGPVVPPEKPSSDILFKRKINNLLTGFYGTTGSKGFLVDEIQSVLDEAEKKGVLSKDDGLNFVRERKKYYDNYFADRAQKQRLRGVVEGIGTVDRKDLSEGSKKYDYKDPQQKNQYVMRTNEEIQEIIDNPKYKNYTRKDFRNEKILTRNETERDGLKFKNFGKKTKVDKRAKQNIKQSAFIKASQGSAISMDQVNNFAHFAPKLKGYLVSTANTGPIKASINRAAEGYDKAIRNIAENQQKLVTEKPKGYVKLLEAENAKAAKLSKDANKILPNQLKGTLGYFQVDKQGNFKLKGVDKAKTFAGLSGDEKVFKTDMTTPQRKDFGKKQSIIQKLIDDVPSLKRASSLKGSSGKGGSGTQAFDMLKPDALSPLRKTKYLSEGGPVKYGKYAKQITKLS
jgi:hypothetical protein